LRSDTTKADAGIFELVILCTGNRFRSPLAEGQIRSLSADKPIRVRSLGLVDLGPVPPLPEALAEASRFELDISAHRARPLHGEDLSGADLVLGFERIHVATAVVEANAPRERTFTLPELVELLDGLETLGGGDPVGRAKRIVALAGEARRSLEANPVLPEIPDPWGGQPELYRRTGERVIELSRALSEHLLGIKASSSAAGRGSRRGRSPGR
jgi:protein-tyrosine-phosphatase